MMSPTSTALDQIGATLDLTALIERLCAQSRESYARPYAFEGWPAEMDRRQWFFSEQLISLSGTPTWAGLDPEQRQLLSFWESIAFFSLNIHGEGVLISGLANRLYAPSHLSVSPYLHHMIEEENKHSSYFAEFCRRYADTIYPDRTLVLAGDPEEAADFLFFARVMIFEDIVDCFNRTMALDDALEPLTRWINAQHHLEERRHLAFGRNLVRRLWTLEQPRWSDAVRSEIQRSLVGYLDSVWRSFANPQTYRDAGLDDPWRLATEAHRHPASVRRRQQLGRRCLNFLTRQGILAEPTPGVLS